MFVRVWGYGGIEGMGTCGCVLSYLCEAEGENTRSYSYMVSRCVYGMWVWVCICVCEGMGVWGYVCYTIPLWSGRGKHSIILIRGFGLIVLLYRDIFLGKDLSHVESLAFPPFVALHVEDRTHLCDNGVCLFVCMLMVVCVSTWVHWEGVYACVCMSVSRIGRTYMLIICMNWGGCVSMC